MSKRSRITALFSVLMVLTVALTAIALPGCQKKGEIKIGAVLPLSGDAAQYGEDIQKGIDLVVEEINTEGGIRGRQLKVIYEDGQASPNPSVSATQKLIEVDNVPVIIGEVASSPTLAMAPLAEQNQVVLISPTASSPDLTNAGEYIFRNWPSDNYEGSVMADFAYSKLGVSEIAVLYINNDYGLGVKDVFARKFSELGGTILIEEQFEQGATDFRTQLSKVKTKEPEAVYVIGYYTEIGLILKQGKEMGLNAQWLCPITFEQPKLLELAGTAAESVIYTAPVYDPSDPGSVVQNFVEAFKTKYGHEPSSIAGHGYDAMKIVALAMERGGFTGPKIQAAMAEIQNFPGVTGETSFDENGDVIKPFMFKTVKNGEFTEYELPE